MATYSWNLTTRATCSVGDKHAHISQRLADSSPTSPVVGYLLPFSQPSIFLPSHIVESPMGTLFLLPHHLSLFSLLLGEKSMTGKREMSTVVSVFTGESIMDSLLISNPLLFFRQSAGKNRTENRCCESFTHTAS